MDKVFVPFLLLLAWAATTYLGLKMLSYAAPPRAKHSALPVARLVHTGTQRSMGLLVALGIVYASVAVMFAWPVGVLISVLA